MSDNFSRKMTFTLSKEDQSAVRILLAFRIVCWCVAIGAFLFWAYWSFELYNRGINDEHEYATALRPVFATGVFISLRAIVISLVLRTVSDVIKRKAEKKELEEDKLRENQ